jgi:hypothetical protein
MEINWIIVAVVAVLIVGLVIYLVVRNHKDKEDLIEPINEPEMGEEEDSL